MEATGRRAYWLEYADWMRDNRAIPCAIAVVYVVSIFAIQKLLVNHKPFGLKPVVVFWNLALAIFSMVGAWHVLPAVYENTMLKGISGDMCDKTAEIANPWVFFFCLSKIPELFDTYLLVLRKRSVILLHWYHHVTVMLYCWDGWAIIGPNGAWFAGMNLIVHSIMYSYFAATAMDIHFPKAAQMVITQLQILQMVLGLAIVVHNLVRCNTDPINAYCALGMYLSYLVLFVQFYFAKYNKPRPEAGRKSVVKKD